MVNYKPKANKLTGPNYRMPGPMKMMLANSKHFKDEHDRGHWKRAMIVAHVESMKQPPADKKKSRGQPEPTGD